MDEAEAQLDGFIDKFTPEVAALTRALLARAKARIPGAQILVYDNYNALAIGFCRNDKAGQAILSLAVMPRWVTLCFLWGMSLSDPHGLLKGKGSRVRHVRLHTPRHPLQGESPILSAALDLGMHNVALRQQLTFFLNQARSSFVLATNNPVKDTDNETLREKIMSRISGMNEGMPLILSNGLKPYPISTSAVDAQLAEMLKMSAANIALAHRIPLQVLGLGESTYSNVEILNQAWLASGLGFTLNHVETAFDNLFGLRGPPEEYTELDTRALLRSAYRERIEGLVRGVISGIYSPDEARNSEDLPSVPGGVGKEPRVQQQVVPLSYGSDMQPPPVNSGPTPPPPADGNPDTQDNPDDSGDSQDAERSLATLRAAYDRERLVAA